MVTPWHVIWILLPLRRGYRWKWAGQHEPPFWFALHFTFSRVHVRSAVVCGGRGQGWTLSLKGGAYPLVLDKLDKVKAFHFLKFFFWSRNMVVVVLILIRRVFWGGVASARSHRPRIYEEMKAGRGFGHFLSRKLSNVVVFKSFLWRIRITPTFIFFLLSDLPFLLSNPVFAAFCFSSIIFHDYFLFFSERQQTLTLFLLCFVSFGFSTWIFL